MSIIKFEKNKVKTEEGFQDFAGDIEIKIENEIKDTIGADDVTIKLEPLVEAEFNSDVVNTEKDEKQLYTCYYCPEFFEYIELYELHTAIHNTTHEMKPCPCCKKKYKNVGKYALHIQEHLNKYKHCPFCNKIFFNQCILKNHIVEHKKNGDMMCNFCGKTFLNRKLLTIHVRVHTNERPYECDICSSRFKQLSSLKSHKELIHSQGTPKECEICHGKFCTRSSLKRHMKMHINGRTIGCKPCKMNFLNKGLYNEHKMKCHSKLSQFFEICPECNEEFFTYREYFYHTKIHKFHKNIKDGKERFRYDKVAIRKDKQIEQNEKYEICWLCGEEVLCSKVTEHKNKHVLMTEKELIECAVSRKFQCKLCKNRYTNKKDLLVHMDTHMDKTFECKKGCGSNYLFSYYGLSRHEHRYHSATEGNINFRKCFLCGLDVLKKEYSSHINDHIQMTPEEVLECQLSNEFPCKQCDAKYTMRKNLLTHIDSHMDKIYQCTKGCTEHLFSYYGLKRHTCRFHKFKDSKKLRKCFLCGFTILFKDYNPHLYDHLQMTEEEILKCHALKEYPCKQCSVVLPTKNSLVRHTVCHMPKTLQCVADLNCRYTLYSYVTLKAHQRSTHDKFICKKCKKSFKGYQTFSSHHHKADYSKKVRKKLFNCLWCSANFIDPLAMTNHYRTHKLMDFRCRICDKRFPRAVDIRTHMNKVHKQKFNMEDCYRYLINKTDSINSIFLCDWCKVRFNTKLALTKHMKIHTGARYECKKCKTSFLGILEYVNHIKSKICTRWVVEALIPEVKHLNCIYCQKSFSEYSEVTEHIVGHHLKERYPCKYCESVHLIESLRTHLWKMHPRKKKYCCIGCTVPFMTFKAYLQHRKGCSEFPLYKEQVVGPKGATEQNTEIISGTDYEESVNILENIVVPVYGDYFKHQNHTNEDNFDIINDNGADFYDVPEKVVVSADGNIVLSNNYKDVNDSVLEMDVVDITCLKDLE